MCWNFTYTCRVASIEQPAWAINDSRARAQLQAGGKVSIPETFTWSWGTKPVRILALSFFRFWSPQVHCWDRRRDRQHARDVYCTVRLYSTTTRLDFMLMSISVRGMHWNLLPMLIQRLHPAEPGGPPSPPSWVKWTVQSGSDSTQTVAGFGLPNTGRSRYVLVVTQQCHSDES